MSVLRYCCFRWLVCDRALVFEPSRPLACIMMLVWLIYVVELCCDIFPWVLDLDRTHLSAWLVYGQIGGVTNWYQSLLPVGIPLSNSLAEVESRHYKTFTNMVVCLTGPHRHLGGIRIFYSSILTLGLWTLFYLEWILLNLTLGSRYHFHPESPLLLMIVCCTWRPWRYSPLLTRELVINQLPRWDYYLRGKYGHCNTHRFVWQFKRFLSYSRMVGPNGVPARPWLVLILKKAGSPLVACVVRTLGNPNLSSLCVSSQNICQPEFQPQEIPLMSLVHNDYRWTTEGCFSN